MVHQIFHPVHEPLHLQISDGEVLQLHVRVVLLLVLEQTVQLLHLASIREGYHQGLVVEVGEERGVVLEGVETHDDDAAEAPHLDGGSLVCLEAVWLEDVGVDVLEELGRGDQDVGMSREPQGQGVEFHIQGVLWVVEPHVSDQAPLEEQVGSIYLPEVLAQDESLGLGHPELQSDVESGVHPVLLPHVEEVVDDPLLLLQLVVLFLCLDLHIQDLLHVGLLELLELGAVGVRCEVDLGGDETVEESFEVLLIPHPDKHVELDYDAVGYTVLDLFGEVLGLGRAPNDDR